MSRSVRIRVPHNPDLAVRLHGWARLRPFILRGDDLCLGLDLPKAGPTIAVIRWDRHGKISACANNQYLTRSDGFILKNLSRWMFRADERFEPFWQICQRDAVLRQCVTLKAGCLLRSATVFEDVVKTICTTNTHWRNTKTMVANLCEEFGKACGEVEGVRISTFPDAETVAGAQLTRLQSTGLGYRATYIRDFAKTVCDGSVDLAQWCAMESGDLFASARAVRGIGPYGASQIAMLLGHYNVIPVDSDVMAYLGLGSGTPMRDVQKVIESRYSKWGDYRFLAYKLHRYFQDDNYVDC